MKFPSIPNIYKELAGKNLDEGALRKETKKLLNKARNRVQRMSKQKHKSTQYQTATRNLRDSGLLTSTGNVSMKLPESRQKLLTVLMKVGGFLENPATTAKGNKESFEEEQRQLEEELNEELEDDDYDTIGDLWQIANDYGIMERTGLSSDVINEKLQELVDNGTSARQFEQALTDYTDNLTGDEFLDFSF